MNIKKRQKLRLTRVNIEMAIKYLIDRDVRRAFEAAKDDIVKMYEN